MDPHLTRREFLKRVGLSVGGLAAAALACGRGPAPTPTPPEATTAPATTAATAPPVTVGPATAPPTPPAQAADMVLLGGKVITVDPHDTIAQAVAIKDGLIQAVGTDEQVRALVGEKTQVVNLQGRTVSPGLVDSHNHLQVMGQLEGFYVPMLPPEVTTIEQLKAKVAEVAAQTPAGEWIQGYFMVVKEGRLPNRQDLDPVSPEHPVWIVQQGGHYGSANSAALQIAGITRATPDPVGGLIERDARGEPTGVFFNHRAMDLLRKVAPRITPKDVRQYILTTEPVFAACGVTSYQDNNVRGVDTVGSYLALGKEGRLTLRGSVYYTLEWPGDVKRALEEVERYPDDGHMRFAGFKFLLDGQLKMAYCHEPHKGVRWDMPTWEPQSFKDAVRALHDTGLQICVHCAGDAAADLTLDAFEAAMNANPRPDPRHRIEHAVFTTPEATQRMKDLGVVVSTQPQFIRLGGDIYADMFGEARAKRAIVTREWLDAGVPLALGSDAPTTPWYTPLATLAMAVARLTYSNVAYEPNQALTIQEALRAHTMGSAYAAHQEEIKGSLEVGKLADLVVWTADPYSSTLAELWEAPVVMTIIGGKIVYQA